MVSSCTVDAQCVFEARPVLLIKTEATQIYTHTHTQKNVQTHAAFVLVCLAVFQCSVCISEGKASSQFNTISNWPQNPQSVLMRKERVNVYLHNIEKPVDSSVCIPKVACVYL